MTSTTQPTSAKILSIVQQSGHHVEMWYCDDEFTREEVNPGDPVKIVLEPVDDGKVGTVREVRTRGGDEISRRTIGQPKIDELVENRSWSVDKQ